MGAERIAVELSAAEKRVLRAGLLDWGGPASPTDTLAKALGFSSAEEIAPEAWALWHEIERASSLTVEDWRRVLLAVEVVFISDVVGSGLDWRHTSGLTDEETVGILRGLQRKLPRWRSSFQFSRDENGGVSMRDAHRRDA